MPLYTSPPPPLRYDGTQFKPSPPKYHSPHANDCAHLRGFERPVLYGINHEGLAAATLQESVKKESLYFRTHCVPSGVERFDVRISNVYSGGVLPFRLVERGGGTRPMKIPRGRGLMFYRNRRPKILSGWCALRVVARKYSTYNVSLYTQGYRAANNR